MFIIYPLIAVLIKSITTKYGSFAPDQFIATLKGYFQLFRVLRHTFTLAGIVGVTSTFLGFIFALLANRSRVKWINKIISVFSLLPIITPPFLIGLAIIYMFGVQGFVTKNILNLHTKAIFGLNGLILAQTLSFAPISYMIMDGLIKSLDASLEEASITLGASRWYTFSHVVWPLLRIGIANSFLLTAIESMADFGNPIVLGGDYDVLATEIYFSIVGRYDEKLASTLGIVLLLSTFFIFLLQQYWIGKKSYITVTGKPTGGRFIPLPKFFESSITTIMLFWFALTGILYGTVIYGSFVKLWGINNSFTLAHYQRFFNEYTGTLGLTLRFAFISAFITAAVGIMISYLISRQRFPGRGYLEFSSLLSFAIPGTVIGIGYLLGFNKYPLMLTGTATIVILSFIFRYMPLGIRSGIAALSQLDPSLEEASTTLGGDNYTTLTKVVFPLIKPAIISGWVFGFVRSITAISAVIFLTTARTRVATVVILNRIEAGTLGIASAYSTILIIIILSIILGMYYMLGKIGIKQEIKL
ncbi:MAG TPA: iron ABC transporter permease [Candidatus Atribacteria bacterium]|nr:iron ABC transporter permease [Candidatus Atribacteria bacterium]